MLCLVVDAIKDNMNELVMNKFKMAKAKQHPMGTVNQRDCTTTTVRRTRSRITGHKLGESQGITGQNSE